MAILIFDLDGTLIDSAADIHAAGNAAVTAHGGTAVTLDAARGFVGHGAEVFIARLMPAAGLPADDPALRARVLDDFLRHYETAVHLTVLYPGVAAAIGRLAQDHKLAICTNKPERATRAVLSHFSLAALFAVVVGGDSLPQRKPDPAPLRAARDRAGPGRCLFIGDSEVDAATARAAGVKFVLFTEGYRHTPVADLPHDAAFAAFRDLPAIVAGLT